MTDMRKENKVLHQEMDETTTSRELMLIHCCVFRVKASITLLEPTTFKPTSCCGSEGA